KNAVDQMQALYFACETEQIKFRKRLYAQLPLICEQCVDPNTGQLQKPKLEKMLEKFGLYRLNALRVIPALIKAHKQLAEQSINLPESPNLKNTYPSVRQQFNPRFFDAFKIALEELVNSPAGGSDPQKGSDPQIEFSAAIRQ